MATLTRDEFIIAAADGVRTADELGALWDSYQPGSNGSAPSAGQIVNLDDYLAGIPTVIPWIVGGFVFDHGVILIAGLPKSGKSTLVTEIMRCLGTGDAFLDRLVARRPVLLVTEESGVPVGFKMHALAGLGIAIYDQRAAAGETFDHTLGKIGVWLAANLHGVVVIDTFAIWAGVDDENSASDVTAAMKLINALAASDDCGAVILIHHQRKGGGTQGEAVRGSGAMVASVDLLIEVKRTGSDDDAPTTKRTLETMGRVGDPARITVDFDTITRRYELVDEAEAFNAQIEEWLADIPTNRNNPGMTRQQIEAIWKCDGKRRIPKLVAKGRLHKGDVQVKVKRGWADQYWAIPPL